jgi:two-component system cell cycle sensor histidine kinase/response regulator CckA
MTAPVPEHSKKRQRSQTIAKPRLLAVDDQAANLLAIEKILAGVNVEVVCAGSGREALRSVLHSEFSLILMDINTPGMDGFETAIRIREHEKVRHIPIIFLGTDISTDTALFKRYSHGAVDFLYKPIVPEILKFKVSAFVELYEKSQEIKKETERLRAQLENQVRQRTAELRVINETLNSIIAASPHGILAVDRERNVFLWNPAATRIFGWSADEVIGGKVPFVPDSQREDSDLFSQRALQGETFTNREVRRMRRDGTPLDLLVSAAPAYDENGTVKGFVTVLTDITEHKKLEQQLFRAQRLESLGTLASGVAHDLNNVLAPIGMALELFRMKLTDETSRSTLNSLETCVNRGSALIRQVLTFARGVQGEHVHLQTKHLMQETEKVLLETFPKSITIHSDVPPDLWLVSADATQIHQVLMNLCVNARDAMADGGTLTLIGQNVLLDESHVQLNPGASAGPHVMIEVRDTGHGIPAEIREKIFEPFFTTKDLSQGTGLGLSTVAAIVRNHGGHVNLYSELGKGTSFKIYLPATPSSASQSHSDRKVITPRGSGELILIADDEAAVRQITRLTLEEHGYRVLEAQDGAEGVAVYAQHRNKIQLVVSDTDMPIMNGAAMLQSLERINPHLKVITTSGLGANNKSPASGKSTGTVRASLPKPYTSEQLLRSVYKVLHSEAL